MLSLRQAHGATSSARREHDFRPPEQPSSGSIGSPSAPSLVWRVFWVNASLLAAAAIILAFSPATVSFPVTARELLVLATGLIVVLLANATMLRFSLRPLLDFERTMNRIVRLMPEEHLQPAGATELESMTAAFNQILQRLEAERRATSRRLVGREEGARKRLASELSAEVDQRLTALLQQLGSIIEEAPPELQPRLLTTQELARDTLEEISRLAQRLCPTTLDDLGLVNALHSLLDLAERNTSVEIQRELQPELRERAPEAELAVYRIVQEALTNVLRHASAQKVTVTARETRTSLVVEIEDNGHGMLYAADHESSGIRGMRDRAIAVGGKLQIKSRPGGGTTVTLNVPEGR